MGADTKTVKPDAPKRSNYAEFLSITTRWHDNDAYGHVNNVVYYGYFDTAVNQYLVQQSALDIQSSDVIGYVVNSQCDYLKAVAFPDAIEAGIRVNRLGNSSVQYGIAIFKAGEPECCAHGSFTHVFVNRETERPAAMPEALRSALERLQG